MDTSTTEPAVELGTLTADDVAALRTSETASFHYYQGRGYISASIGLHSLSQRIYTAREQRLFPSVKDSVCHDRSREINVQTTMHGYTDDGGTAWRLDQAPFAAAFAMLHSARYDEPWCTTVSLLRTGDVLTLSWVADNNSETIREAKLHVDTLSLKVQRGKHGFTFHVDTSITPDNSARMIQRNGH